MYLVRYGVCELNIDNVIIRYTNIEGAAPRRLFVSEVLG